MSIKTDNADVILRLEREKEKLAAQVEQALMDRDGAASACERLREDKRQLAARLRAVERRVIELERAVARYQDELWESGKL